MFVCLLNALASYHLKTPRNEFVVDKADIPVGGEDDLILLQDLMTIKSNEVEDDIISELDLSLIHISEPTRPY